MKEANLYEISMAVGMQMACLQTGEGFKLSFTLHLASPALGLIVCTDRDWWETYLCYECLSSAL